MLVTPAPFLIRVSSVLHCSLNAMTQNTYQISDWETFNRIPKMSQTSSAFNFLKHFNNLAEFMFRKTSLLSIMRRMTASINVSGQCEYHLHVQTKLNDVCGQESGNLS